MRACAPPTAVFDVDTKFAQSPLLSSFNYMLIRRTLIQNVILSDQIHFQDPDQGRRRADRCPGKWHEVMLTDQGGAVERTPLGASSLTASVDLRGSVV